MTSCDRERYSEWGGMQRRVGLEFELDFELNSKLDSKSGQSLDFELDFELQFELNLIKSHFAKSKVETRPKTISIILPIVRSFCVQKYKNYTFY